MKTRLHIRTFHTKSGNGEWVINLGYRFSCVMIDPGWFSMEVAFLIEKGTYA